MDKKTILLLMLLQGIIPGILSGQTSPDREIIERVNTFVDQYAPQKVYLHLNKENYNAGDAIWFQAYLMDGISHIPDLSETNINVDLVNREGIVMEKRILKSADGRSTGDIILPIDIPDGNYMIRAYTNRMRNFGKEYYYSQNIYIHNPDYEDIVPRREVRSNRRFNRRLDRKHDNGHVAFFPEGGHIVANFPTRVAIKVVNDLGMGLPSSGEITRGRSEVVATFETDESGTASFEYTPTAGGSYRASVSINGGRSRNYRLPEVQPLGTSMRVDQVDDNIMVDIFSTDRSQVVLLAHARGNIIYGENVSLDNGSARIELPREDFPSGISHLTVFSRQNAPLSERLVFVDHNDAFIFYPEVERQEYEGQEYFLLSMKIMDGEGEPVSGNFSLSVLHSEHDISGFSSNIVSYLLVTSDLPGIRNEVHRFLNPEEDMSDALDHLMLTNGWRRFAWNDVMAGRLPEIRYQPSSALSIGGVVQDPSSKRALPNFPVRLEVIEMENGTFKSNTDTDGNFLFDGLEFYDDVNIRISSERLISNHPPEFELDAGELTQIEYIHDVNTHPQQVTRRGDNWERVHGAGVSPYTQITEASTAPQQYGVPDQTVFLDPNEQYTNMHEVLVSRVRGLNHNLQFRGPSSFFLSNEPVFMLDGSEVSRNVFLSIDPRYLQRLEVFRGTRASIFGVRGATGVILAYTRRAGDQGIAAYKEYLVRGYHAPTEFYQDIVNIAHDPEIDFAPGRAIWWEPELSTDWTGTLSVIVPAESQTGIHKFIIEGAGQHGGVGHGVFTIMPSPGF